MRIGIGYDSHRFAKDRKLILGGVEIPHDLGLEGHSDADAIAHALTDALLGAAALGDIGTHFPPSDNKWKDADSLILLEHVQGMVRNAGYGISNVDITVICEVPKVGRYVGEMREKLASTLNIDAGQVSIKGKTNEGMGWIGRNEGIAVIAVVLIES